MNITQRYQGSAFRKIYRGCEKSFMLAIYLISFSTFFISFYYISFFFSTYFIQGDAPAYLHLFRSAPGYSIDLKFVSGKPKENIYVLLLHSHLKRNLSTSSTGLRVYFSHKRIYVVQTAEMDLEGWQRVSIGGQCFPYKVKSN